MSSAIIYAKLRLLNVLLWTSPPFGGFLEPMNDFAPINLNLDAVRADFANFAQTLDDLRCAFDGFNAGQARVIEGQAVTNRLLDQLVRAVDQESDAGDTAELLRALLTAIKENTAIVKAIPHKVEAAVALHTTGEIIPPCLTSRPSPPVRSPRLGL